MIVHKTYDCVLKALNEYLLVNSEYDPEISTTPDGDVYPKVIVEELENSALKKDNMNIVSLSLVGIKIDIYAMPMKKGTKMLAGRTIARELCDLCSVVCEDMYGLKRTTCKPTPNIDDKIYRLTMIYNNVQSDTGRSLFL